MTTTTKAESTKGNMLIIDDDPSFGMVLQAIAQNRGFETHYVPSLLDLGSFARIKDFEIAVIDYYLGSLRGDEIAEYVDMFFQEVPVIIVSSKPFTQEDIKKWPSCVRQFVAKTEGQTRIMDRVVRVLDRDRMLKRFQNRTVPVPHVETAAGSSFRGNIRQTATPITVKAQLTQ